MATKITQGDSYWKDFSSPTIPTFTSEWAGVWGIVESTGTEDVVKATGILTRSSDNTKLQVRILPTDTEDLPPKNYNLVVKVFNPTIGFKREVLRETITILKQGLVV